jgi:hypothetical protein
MKLLQGYLIILFSLPLCHTFATDLRRKIGPTCCLCSYRRNEQNPDGYLKIIAEDDTVKTNVLGFRVNFSY